MDSVHPVPEHPRSVRSLAALDSLVAREAVPWAKRGRTRHLTSALNMAGKLGCAKGADTALRLRICRRLAEVYLPLVPGLRAAGDCLVALQACAAAGFWGGGLAAALLQRLGQDGGALLREASSQGQGYVWWSLSAAPPDLISASDRARLLAASAAALLRLSAAQLSAQDCSVVLLAAARLAHRHDALLHHLAACLVQLQRGCGRGCCEGEVEAEQQRAPGAACELEHQAIANALYALGELARDTGHVPRPKDLSGLAEAARRGLGSSGRVDGPDGADSVGGSGGGGGGTGRGGAGGGFVPQALSSMLLGCARLGYADVDLLRPLVAAAAEAAPAMNPQELANSLYAAALLGCVAEGYGGAVEALAAECCSRRFVGFTAQGFANCVWALAKLGHVDQGWYAAAVEAAETSTGPLSYASAQEWANLWYALALVRHQPATGRLLELTAGAAGILQADAGDQACANLLWALANLRLYDERLVDALAGRLGELLGRSPGQPTSQGLCNSLWALAVMGPEVLSRHSGLVEGLLREAERRWAHKRSQVTDQTDDVFSLASLFQLWHVQLELASLPAGADGAAPLSAILANGSGQPDSLLAAARAASAQRVAAVRPARASSLEGQVLACLDEMTVLSGGEVAAVRRSYIVRELCRVVDVFVELAGGRRVAVEVDGPSHFLANRPRDLTAVEGSTALRNRQLERVFGRGNVLSVPWWEWAEATAAGKAAQRAYLSRLLGLDAAWAGHEVP
ncbi:hypothetical protein HYH03_004169 [Edaphochlamys debaryana]|uniref:RAP domain-containing protein n=1 Tax=Edaphochlamys debaryana TaxID=47281 RepID=A0A836C3P5_9CHLO|nr:hypothetical protein HYH03_004169 [Edaphochlamys debaryana]|eukprot:KAG2497904.1 hypothetical protein HYH03_004169 [Edaphochlamys debaryana]